MRKNKLIHYLVLVGYLIMLLIMIYRQNLFIETFEHYGKFILKTNSKYSEKTINYSNACNFFAIKLNLRPYDICIEDSSILKDFFSHNIIGYFKLRSANKIYNDFKISTKDLDYKELFNIKSSMNYEKFVDEKIVKKRNINNYTFKFLLKKIQNTINDSQYFFYDQNMDYDSRKKILFYNFYLDLFFADLNLQNYKFNFIDVVGIEINYINKIFLDVKHIKDHISQLLLIDKSNYRIVNYGNVNRIIFNEPIFDIQCKLTNSTVCPNKVNLKIFSSAKISQSFNLKIKNGTINPLFNDFYFDEFEPNNFQIIINNSNYQNIEKKYKNIINLDNFQTLTSKNNYRKIFFEFFQKSDIFVKLSNDAFNKNDNFIFEISNKVKPIFTFPLIVSLILLTKIIITTFLLTVIIIRKEKTEFDYFILIFTFLSTYILVTSDPITIDLVFINFFVVILLVFFVFIIEYIFFLSLVIFFVIFFLIDVEILNNILFFWIIQISILNFIYLKYIKNTKTSLF